MRIRFDFNPEKAIETILFIAQNAPIPDIYHVCKILYFADKAHLEKYGRSINGDDYVAMRNGPVPSNVYDIIKGVRGDGQVTIDEHALHSFQVKPPYIIQPLRPVNIKLLSKSDIECLLEAIEEYGQLTFDEIKEISHADPAFKAADENDFIAIEKIVETLNDSESLLDHLLSGSI